LTWCCPVSTGGSSFPWCMWVQWVGGQYANVAYRLDVTRRSGLWLILLIQIQ